MTLRYATVLAAPLALALSGCGRSNDASTEAQADTVEIPANEALAPITEMPVADPSANAAMPTDTGTPAMTEDEKIQAAGDSAADTAAMAADAMDESSAAAMEEKK